MFFLLKFPSVFICYRVFFFFKQKTAYEMRISDWSSDVCSSDLIGDQGFDMMLSGRVARTLARNLQSNSDSILSGHRPDEIGTWAIHPGGQIGRASCRERVCQYV